MTHFDILTSILSTKRELELGVEDEKEFSLYMLNRWISMYSPEKAILINSTINKWWSIFETKQEQYDFLLNLIGTNKFKKIKYTKKAAKKAKTDKDDVEENLARFAHNNFMSLQRLKELQTEMGL